MLRMTSRRRTAIGLAGAAVVALSLVACGGNDNGGSTGGAATPASSVDSALAAKVPDKIKSDGKILVGIDSTYAPSEFLDTDGKTVIGFDVDVFNAVAAKLGLKAEYQSAKFGDIIPGIQSGKYEIGVSSFTINTERKAAMNMVSYFSAGTQWAAKTGATIDPNNACGKKVAVQQATVQVDDLTAKSKACTTAGKPAITIEQFQDQGQATASVVSGKNDAMLADSPVCAYAVKQTNGQLALAGEIYDSAPYGYVVAKQDTAFADALQGALTAVIADGSYTAALKKWGVEAGGITQPAVNP
jgi:polar amino acid transport system substrate-binding protein